MTITVNGRTHTCDPGTTVTELLTVLGHTASGSAVALNGEVLPRGTWPDHPVREGDQVDVLTAVQGG